VSAEEITGMGVGGLLMEIGSRPQPREETTRQPRIAAIILAAGQSRRMGSNKLLAQLGGKPLVRHVAEAAKASMAAEVLLVTGHDAQRVEKAVAGASAKLVHNAGYRRGMGTSLAAGLAALPENADGAVILLGDMPGITAGMIDRLLEAAASRTPMPIVMAMANGVRGNPVVLPRRHFAALRKLEGDEGARRLIAEHGDEVVTVELGEAAASDLDTPEALAKVGAQPVG
jgi:molybdenum cofactor cytidylyltransferase